MRRIVIGTNVFVTALRAEDNASTASRSILRAALTGQFTPLFGNALWHEYEDLLGREEVWTRKTAHNERENMLKALAAVGEWVTIYYGWRPNLPDEGDNHLIELAIAGNALAIVTYNKKDLFRGQLVWPELKILSPSECLKEFA